MIWFPAGIVDSGAGFSPTDIANLQLWLDAKDQSSLTIGTAPDVTTWADISGGGHTPTQGTVANRPHDASVNGNESVQFDGSDDLLRDSSAGALVSPPITVGLVITPTTVTGTGQINTYRNGTTNVIRMNANGTAFDAIEGSGGAGTVISISAVLAIGETRWFVARFRNSGDGASDLLDDQANSASASVAASIADVDDLELGAAGNNTNNFGGHIHEIVSYNAFISDADRTALGNYFSNRWAIG